MRYVNKGNVLSDYGKWIRNALNFEARCCRRMKISWTDRVKNEDVLRVVKEEINILRTTERRKARWIGHIA
jgi:DNA-directed RNA polymerase subunit N (RpoN/RPB10)